MEEFKATPELSQAIQENRKQLRETLGKFFLDLAKIAFSTMVVGSLVSIVTGLNQRASCVLMAIGFVVTGLLVFTGYKIIKLKRKGKDMESLIFLYVLTGLACIALLIWFRTKSGKKWLDDL